MKVSAARLSAFDVLREVQEGGGTSAALLAAAEASLSASDAALTHQIVLGSLRRQIVLDSYIDQFANGKKLDIEVRIASRIGLFQIWYLDRVPPHASVNESVSLVGRAGKASAKGFVNALLRRATTSPPQSSPVVGANEFAETAFSSSHPEWLIEKWALMFGVDRAGSIAEANNVVPRLAFRKTIKFKPENNALLDEYHRSDLVPNGFWAKGIDPTLRSLSAEGEIYFQDEGSQLIGSVLKSENGGRILDLCAAPGGKTCIASIQNPNAFIVACDTTTKRTNLLRHSLILQGIERPNVVRLDAEKGIPFDEQTFDLVFLDAPCTGTGTIQSNPEIRYRVTKGSIELAFSKQLRLIANASKGVKKGGYLIYATCSLEREENENVVNSFLLHNDSFKVVEAPVSERFRQADGFVRTFPDIDGIAGFFLAMLRREK